MGEEQTYEWREVLPAVDVLLVRLGQRISIPQHKRNLHDPRCSGGHQRPPEHRMHVRAQLQPLRMRTHRPPGQNYHERWQQIAFRPAIPLPTEPHAQQPGTPPHDPHARMLQVVLHPRRAPAVFRERVHAAPGGDQQRIEELLTPPRPREPPLTDQQQNREDDPVPDEGAAHDEMRQALAQMIPPAEPQSRDPPEQHLHPADYGHRFPHDPVGEHHVSPYASVDALFKVQLEVDSERDLGE